MTLDHGARDHPDTRGQRFGEGRHDAIIAFAQEMAGSKSRPRRRLPNIAAPRGPLSSVIVNFGESDMVTLSTHLRIADADDPQ
jgi:hypothetical protein